MNKTLMLISIILILSGGFKISINNHSFEWIGILEQILNSKK